MCACVLACAIPPLLVNELYDTCLRFNWFGLDQLGVYLVGIGQPGLCAVSNQMLVARLDLVRIVGPLGKNRFGWQW